MKDPIRLFNAAVKALNDERWLDVAGLCDPTSLQEFKSSAIAQFETLPEHIWTVEDFLRHSPDMPREVAEYQLSQIQRQAHPDTRFARDFPLLSSPDELHTLEPQQVFASWLEGRSAKSQFDQMVRAGRISNADLQAHADILVSMKHELSPIGSIPDGNDLVHVLYRWGPEPTLETLPVHRAFPMVTSCIRQPGGGWCLIADYNFLSIGSLSLGVDGVDAESA